MKHIHLHVDRLVLRGFRHEDRHGIAEGIQQELTRMFAYTETAQQLTAHGDISRLKVGNVRIGQEAKPQSVGTQVAESIGKGVTK